MRIPESGTHPRVYYRNIPGRFIAGTVYDPVEEAVIRNARCSLQMGERSWDATTDIFGDFWFRDLPRGRYDLTIEAEGFAPLVFQDLDTENDSCNLGDQPMTRQ